MFSVGARQPATPRELVGSECLAWPVASAVGEGARPAAEGAPRSGAVTGRHSSWQDPLPWPFSRVLTWGLRSHPRPSQCEIPRSCCLLPGRPLRSRALRRSWQTPFKPVLPPALLGSR